jgi:hypothetical protein
MRSDVEEFAVGSRFILFLNVEDADASGDPERPDSLQPLFSFGL